MTEVLPSQVEIATLDNCENEPIHVPGAIQPHGALVVCDPNTLIVSQASENLLKFFGVEARAALGQPFSALLDAESAERLAQIAGEPRLRERNPFRLTSLAGTLYDTVAHRSGGALVIEVEPASTVRTENIAGFDPRLRASVLRMQDAGDIARLTATAADEVRALTGFDRVMVYRFDADWNGQVVSESKRSDLESFLGWHYPASDIPAQARRLYTVNWLRFIVDVDYRPARLVSAVDANDSGPLDLSHSILRSVSPIHIEYLKNMGVRASMSISLVVDGTLTGLIACHHYSGPRLVPLTVRDTAEYFGQTLSWQLKLMESADRAARAQAALRHEAELVKTLAIAGDLLDGLSVSALLELTQAHGAAVVLEEGTRCLGFTPGSEPLRKIVDWLTLRGEDVFVTDQLSAHIPEAEAWTETAAGLLAVAVAPALGEYLLWFRAAETRVVNWGGDPRKAVTRVDGEVPRLSPRGSFALWEENVKGRSMPWAPWKVEAASSLRRALLGGVRKRAAQLRTANQLLLDADRAKDDFLATVSHELRTPLNAIIGWTSLLKKGSLDAERAGHALDVIERNAKNQTKLIEDLLDVSRITSGNLELEADRVDLSALLSSALESSSLAFEAKHLEVQRELPEGACFVRGDAARLRQVIGNLLTNAVKFTPAGGHIRVGLRNEALGVEIYVSDDGEGIEARFLPHVFEPFRQQDSAKSRRHQGLGLGLAIVKKLIELHGGQVAMESPGRGQGATVRVWLPVALAPLPARHDEAPSKTLGQLDGVAILVIEDDEDSRELLASILSLAHAEVRAVGAAQAALDELSLRSFDVILSDVGLPEMDGLEFMRTLRERPAERLRLTPAVALTAYAHVTDRAAVIQAGFQAHLSKPVDADELIATLLKVLARGA